MSSIDVESLLRPLAEDSPCGPDLEYDPEMATLEEVSKGKGEQQYGDTIIPAEPPDWNAARKSALSLLERTKDIRVAITLGNACLGLRRLDEFADVMRLIEGYVKQFWPHVHPELDADDDNDPTSRINALAALCDHASTLRLVVRTPVVSAPGLGAFSLLDIQVAHGEVLAPPEMEEEPTSSTIDAAFLNAPLENLEETRQLVDNILDALQSIEATVTQQVGAGQAMSLDKLREHFETIKTLVAKHLAERSGQSQSAADTEAGGDDSESEVAAATGGAKPKANPGEINSREDVIRAIDRICEYYARVEPSSPLPLLLNRAKRLATKSFLDIIKDLTPDALSQATAIAGGESDSDE